ncbi:MAG: putative prolin-rich exported protein [Bryobacterales bacterium]|nr:putative prolin-rich exported protein [Bryobacterales bacterium]
MVRVSEILGTLFLGAIVCASFGAAAFAQDDPPSRVARLNYVNGNVSMEPAGVDEWAPAVINRPFTIGDYLYTDRSSVAELHLDNAVMRMGQLTSFGFLNLTDQTAQLKLTEGDLNVRIHDLSANEVFEVDTPNAAITLLRDGVYRINVDPDANTTFVFTKSGQAEATGGGQAFALNPGNSALLSGTDQLAFDIQGPPEPDSFDNWCAQRDAHEAQLQSRRYLPPTVVGSEDMDDYGTWSEEPQYGAVWYPRSVPVGWAPYHAGHWAWIEPWGWTWVDDAPWGFAPFHYGRWVYWHDRWGWAPGPCARVAYGGPVVRPVYAPALVAWFGGAHWGVSVSVGGGAPSLGWVPLGWGEVYTPSYRCSRPYFNNVNVNTTRMVNNVNITNVYNTVYVNKTVYNQTFVNVKAPNALVAMPQSAFASGRPVTQAGYNVRPGQLARFQPAQAALVTPPVAPTRQAIAPTLGRPAVRPSPQLMQRQVIARSTPPLQPAAFAARQAFLQQHAGQPHDFAAMRQATGAQAHPAAVREASRMQPGTVHQVERVGNVPAPTAGRGPGPGAPQQAGRPAPGTQAPRGVAGPQPIQPQQEHRMAGSSPQPSVPGTPQQPVSGQPPQFGQGTPPNLKERSQPVQRNATPQLPEQPRAVQPQEPPIRNERGVPPNARQGNTEVQPNQNRPTYNGSNDRRAQPAAPNTPQQPARQSYPAQRQPEARPPEMPRPTPQSNSGEQQRANEQRRSNESHANQQPRPAERPANVQPEHSHEQHGAPPNREQRQDSKPDHKEK